MRATDCVVAGAIGAPGVSVLNFVHSDGCLKAETTAFKRQTRPSRRARIETTTADRRGRPARPELPLSFHWPLESPRVARAQDKLTTGDPIPLVRFDI
jgi:hypothetical protein